MAKSYDVWLVKLQKRDAATVMAVGKLFGVSQAIASQIIANLPRLVVVDVPSAAAEAVARDLRRIGGMPHVTRTGEGPNFEAPSVQTSGAPPGQVKKRIRRSAQDEAAREQKSRADDAASLHWPDEATPYTWVPHPDREPPPVPAPVRNSAARVVLLLGASLALIVGGVGAWWFAVGVEAGSAATGTWATPDAGIVHHATPDDERADGAAAEGATFDAELARSLAVRLKEEAWQALVLEVAGELDLDPEPLELAGHPAGVRFEVRARDTLRIFKALHPVVRAAGASLFRVERGDTVRADVVALLPLADKLDVLRLFGTGAPERGISNDDVRAWIDALDRKQSIFLSGVGPDFVQGRFEVPLRDESVLSDPSFRCPGAGEDGSEEPEERETVQTLKNLRKGERFTCVFR